MSAQDNLNGQQFYHGTAADLRPGSLIHPAAKIGRPVNFPGYESKDHAYATPSQSHAGEYAQLALDWAYNRRQGHGKSRRVYEVQPTGPIEADPDDTTTDAYRSTSPWKVTRRVPVSEWDK